MIQIVGNYNKHATKHNVIWSFMKSDSDYIENLDKIIGELITHYWRESGVYPEKILYYREGILEDNIWMVSFLSLCHIIFDFSKTTI